MTTLPVLRGNTVSPNRFPGVGCGSTNSKNETASTRRSSSASNTSLRRRPILARLIIAFPPAIRPMDTKCQQLNAKTHELPAFGLISGRFYGFLGRALAASAADREPEDF